MKYVVSRAINILSLSIIGLMLLLTIFLILFNFSDFYLEKNHKNIEDFVSKIVGHPVTIAKINSGNNGLDPSLILRNIIVYDKTKTKKIIQAQKFQVSVDLLGSLLSWRIKPGLLMMSGVDLSFDQDKNRDSSIDAVYWDGFKEFYWLFEQSKVFLKNINISLRLVDGRLIELNNLNLKLYNDSLQYKLKINGVLLQKNTPAKFSINLKLRILPINSSLSGLVKIEDLLLNIPDKATDSDLLIPHDLIPPNGSIGVLIENSQIMSDIFNNSVPIDNLNGSLVWQNSGRSSGVVVAQRSQLDLGISRIAQIYNQLLEFFKSSSVIRWVQESLGLATNPETSKKPLDPADSTAPQQAPGEQLNISLNDFSLTSGDLELSGGIKISSPMAKFDPSIDANIDLFLKNLSQAKLYYPAKLMPKDAVVWLNSAFISSESMSGRVIFKGPLAKFPFDNKEGVFFANASINNVHLNYYKDWPTLENVTGKLIFSNRSMEILAQNAKIMQSRIDSVRAFIPDLNKPVLSIGSTINTESQFGLEFINQSPLKASLGEKLKHISLRGPMQLGLKLLIPLDDSYKDQKTQVSGDIVLTNNYLSPKDFNFGINGLEGELNFTQDALFAKDMRGELFKYPVAIDIDTIDIKAKDTLTKIILNGRAAAKDVAAGFDVKLDEKVKGVAKYKALFEIHNTLAKNSFLRVDSDLQNVSIDLPEPLFKNSTSSKKSSFTYYFSDAATSKAIIKYGDQVTASFDKNKNLLIGVDKLDLSLWSDYLSKLKKDSNNKSKDVFNKLILKINKLNAFGQSLSKALVEASRDEQNLRINIAALPQIKGNILISKNPTTKISGVFEQLQIKSIGNTKKFTSNIKPQNIALLDFVIENFSYNDKNFHKISITTRPQLDGMEISKLNIDHPDFQMKASGNWVSSGANKQQTSLHGNLYTQNAGNLLTNLGLNNNVIGGLGGTNFELAWQQAPHDFSLKSLVGKFTVELKKGYIVNLGRSTEVKLGVGKALNALSLRHLSLDVTSVTKKGLKFDKFDANADIINGSATVKSLKLEGPIARVIASGRIGLVAKDYDMYVNVIPHITSSVPIAATFAAGPIIGLLSWVVADVVIAPVIKKATTYKYHVTGEWDNPKVEKS